MKKILIFSIILLALVMTAGNSIADGNDYWLVAQFAASGGVILKAVVSETGTVYIQNNTLGMTISNVSAGIYSLRWRYTIVEPTIVAIADDTTGLVTVTIANKNTTGCSIYVTVQSAVTHTVASARVDINGNVTQVIGGCTTGAVSTGIRSVRWTAHSETPTVSVICETSGVVQAMYYNVQVNGCSVATYVQSAAARTFKAQVDDLGNPTVRTGSCTSVRTGAGTYIMTYGTQAEEPAISVTPIDTTVLYIPVITVLTETTCYITMYNTPTDTITAKTAQNCGFSFVAVVNDLNDPELADVPYSVRAESGDIIEPTRVNCGFNILGFASQ